MLWEAVGAIFALQQKWAFVVKDNSIDKNGRSLAKQE